MFFLANKVTIICNTKFNNPYYITFIILDLYRIPTIMKPILLVLFTLLSFPTSWAQPTKNASRIEVGASRIQAYLPLLKNKKVGLVINQTSMVQGVSLLDTLLTLQVSISKIFTPTDSSPDKMMVAVANQSSFQNNTTNEE